MSYFKRAWRGEVVLWKLFWLVGIAMAVLVTVLGVLIMPIGFMNPMSPVVIGVQIVTVIISLFWHILIWKNARNAKWRGWFYIVRVLVAIGVIFVIASPFLQQQNFRQMNQMKLVLEGMKAQMQAAPAENQAPAPVVQQEAQPVVVGSGPAVDTVAIEQKCTQQLRDHATKGGVDPDAYVASNQNWVSQCMMAEVKKTHEQ